MRRNIVITIGTPVDEFQNPVLRVMKECIDDLEPYLDNDQLILLRSTVYPGTTDWMHRYLADEYDKHPQVAFLPGTGCSGQGN